MTVGWALLISAIVMIVVVVWCLLAMSARDERNRQREDD